MERYDDREDELIDLGTASVETRGPLAKQVDQTGGIHSPGLSND